MTIGERIKQRRIELGMSQDELAKKIGYKSRSSINKIEIARDLPLRKVEQMAAALETTPSFLMGWENPEDMYYAQLAEAYVENQKMELYREYLQSPALQNLVEVAKDCSDYQIEIATNLLKELRKGEK